MTQDPQTIRASLLDQHGRLRELLATAVAHARVGEPATALATELDAIRNQLDNHNVDEQFALEPLLRWDYAWGPERIEAMIAEHAAEHALLRQLLVGDDAEIATRLPDVADAIAAQLDLEERTFLTPRALRQDIVTTEDGD